MANLNSVLSQIAQQLTRIEAKLDALLKAGNIQYVEPERMLASPKPTKTYVSDMKKSAPAPTAPVTAETAPVAPTEPVVPVSANKPKPSASAKKTK